MTERTTTFPDSEGQDSGFSGQDLSKELAELSEAPQPHDYQYLKHNYADRAGVESSSDLRARYVRYTDKMIAQVKELADPSIEPGPDGRRDTGVTMVFLDKSARPAYWLMDELWDLYAPGYERPDIKFANIDREQWQDQTGRIDLDEGMSHVDVDHLDPSVFWRLRETFRDPIHPEKSVFDGRKIMVVDETRTTGTTLEIAYQLFKKTFVEADDVSPYHWMVSPRGDQRTSEVPVWYDENSPHGRGVSDRDFDRSQASSSSRQREGSLFLSTRSEELDTMAVAIRKEMHYIREDLLSGAMRFSVQEHDDNDIAPELLEAVTPWRIKRKAENAKH